MTIVKLRKPFVTNTQWMTDGPFIWVNQLAFVGYTQPPRYDSSYVFGTIVPDTAVEVGDLFVDNEQYEEKSSRAELDGTEKSWFFDIAAQKLYVHVEHTKRMDSSSVDTNRVRGYSTQTVFVDSNNITYTPHLRSSLTLRVEADRLVYNKLGFVSNNAKFDNADAEFNYTIEEPTPGADINFLYISQEDLDAGNNILTPIYTGISRGDRITKGSNGEYTVRVIDKRRQLSKKIPNTRFNSTDFPNIAENVKDNVIPEGYGDLIGIPAFCTNGNITSGNVEYKYAADGTSLTAAYVKVEDAWNSVTPVSTDPTNGELALSASDARDSSGNPRDVKVDARLRSFDSPGDIIVDIINREYNQQFTSEYYQADQWTTENALLADIYLYMGQSKDFFDYIEEIQNASDYGFRFDINAEGKYTMKVDDINRESSAYYPAICNISDSTPVERDFEDYATSVRVSYNQDQVTGDSSDVVSDGLEEEVFNKYRLFKEESYSSNLKTETDAQNKADRIALDFSESRAQIDFSLDFVAIHEIFDVITIDTSTYDGIDQTNEYYGERKIKLSRIVTDLNLETTTLTGYDITDIV